MNQVAAIFLNYNMPEVIEANIQRIIDKSETPCDLIVVDNGSDEEYMFVNENNHDVHTIYLDYNLRATHGYRMGLQYANSLSELRYQPYDAYWILTTTGTFSEEDQSDPLTPLFTFLQENEDAVAIQAAHDSTSQGFWDHLKDRGSGEPRRVWFMEHSACLFDAEWFDEIDWMHPGLHVHGTDLHYSWLARIQNKSLWVHEGLKMHRHTNNMFELGRAPESGPEERTKIARASMTKTLSEELGPDWEKQLFTEMVEEEWR